MDGLQNRTIQLQDYQHEKDLSVMTQIMESKLFEEICRFVSENHIEDACLYSYYSSCIQLNRQTAPMVDQLLRKACTTFGLENVPDVLLCREYEETMQIIGFSKPALLISSVYLEQLDEAMLYGALCGQVAGIQAQHQKTLFMIWIIENLSGMLLFLNPASLALVNRLLNEWRRNRFFTYDRAFYLATENKQLALQQIFVPSILKGILNRFPLGTDADPYRQQVERFMKIDPLKLAGKEFYSIANDSSWLPIRYKELCNFMEERRKTL